VILRFSVRYKPGSFCPWPVLRDSSPDHVLLVLLPPRRGVCLLSLLLFGEAGQGAGRTEGLKGLREERCPKAAGD